VNSTVEKNGYFIGAIWSWSTTDAPGCAIHFPGQKSLLTRFPRNNFSGLPSYWMSGRNAARDADFLLSRGALKIGKSGMGRSQGRHRFAADGLGARWPDAQRYRNQDGQGRMHFPGFSAEAVKVLIERKVSGLGCDTLSADYGASTDFAVHHLALGSGIVSARESS